MLREQASIWLADLTVLVWKSGVALSLLKPRCLTLALLDRALAARLNKYFFVFVFFYLLIVLLYCYLIFAHLHS